MANIFSHLDQGAKNVLEVLRRFPLISIAAFLMSIILIAFSMQVHVYGVDRSATYLFANRFAFVMTLAIPLFLLLRLISANRLLSLLGVVIIATYVILIPNDFEQHETIKHLHLTLIFALTLLIFVAPFLFRSPSNKTLWEWIQQLLFALITSFIFTIMLYLGIKGILFSIEKLFDVSLPITSYRRDPLIMLFLFGTFSTNYFLAQLPKEPRRLKPHGYSKIETIFTKYILTPLTGIYFLILFAYTSKIIFFSEFPSGVMSKLVIAFSALAITTLLFWTPMWSPKNEKYKKLLWVAILLQTFVLALSIYLRIEQYGVTQNRYTIALLGFWLFAVSLFYLFSKRGSYKWLFISLSMLLLLSQFGPFSAKNVSQRSQVAQLKKLLGENPNLNEETNKTIRYQISSKIEYLYRKHKIDALMPVLPQIVSEYKLLDQNRSNCAVIPYEQSFPHYATQKLGFKFIEQWEWEMEKQNKHKEEEFPLRISRVAHEGVEIRGFDWMEQFSYSKRANGEPFCPPKEENEVEIAKSPYTITTKEHQILIEKASKVLATIELAEFVEKLQKVLEKTNKRVSPPYPYPIPYILKSSELSVEYTNEQVEVKVLFNQISLFQKEHKMQYYSGEIFLHEK